MKWIVGILIVLGVSCAVVNVYVTFPEEKIRKAAEDILGPSTEESKPQSYFKFQFGKNLYAEEVKVSKDLKTDSPLINEAKAKRKTWEEKLINFKKMGFVGETNRFSVVIKEMPSDKTLSEEVKDIVMKENKERDVIINELMRINNASPAQEKIFRDIFTEVVQKQLTPKGAWIQINSGEWIKKE